MARRRKKLRLNRLIPVLVVLVLIIFGIYKLITHKKLIIDQKTLTYNIGEGYYDNFKATFDKEDVTSKVKVTNNVNRNCTDNSKCCSESNPTKCDWATACRQGVTKLSIDLDNKYDGDFAWAGTARHNIKLDDYGNPILQNGNAISTGANDKIYILKDASGNEITKTATDNSGTMLYIKVYVPEYASYYGSNSNPTYKFVWIPKKCVGTYNKICPYSKCTG